MHDIIGDIIDWDEAHRAYLASAGQTGERYNQRLEAASGWLRSRPGGSISLGGSTVSGS